MAPGADLTPSVLEKLAEADAFLSRYPDSERRGELTRTVTVQAHAFSKSAEDAITAAGGSIERLPLPWGDRRPPAKGNHLTNR